MSPLAFILFNGLLWLAAVGDLGSYRIPNWLSLAVAAGAVLAHPPAGLDELWSRLAAVGVLGVAGGALWLRGLFGGGDYKLLWACALWIGLSGLAPFLLAFGAASACQGVTVGLGARLERRRSGALDGSLNRRVPLALSIAAAGLYWSLLQMTAAGAP